MISAVMASIWNVFIKFCWHDEKFTAVNRQGHFGHRDIFGWIFGSFFSKTSAAWKSDKGNAHSDWISHHCGCLRRREYNRVVFCWLTSSHLVLHKAVNAIFFGVCKQTLYLMSYCLKFSNQSFPHYNHVLLVLVTE